MTWLDRMPVLPLESAVPVVDRYRRHVMIYAVPNPSAGETRVVDLDHPQGVAYALRLIIAAGHEYEMAPKAACELWEDLCHGRLTDADRLAIADALAAVARRWEPADLKSHNFTESNFRVKPDSQASDKAGFGASLRAAIKALPGTTTDSLAAELGLGDGGAAWLRSLTSGRSANVSRAQCGAMEAALGLAPDELWDLLLQDHRKVDPEVREHYENKVAILGNLLAQQATDLTWVRPADGMAFTVSRDAVARFVACLEFAAPDIDMVLDGLGAALADYREVGFEGGDLLHSLNRFLALPAHHRQMRLAAFAAELAASAVAYVPQGSRTMRQAVANGDLPGGPDALQTFMRHVAAGGAAVARDAAAARLHGAALDTAPKGKPRC